jgi:hypothetical protein
MDSGILQILGISLLPSLPLIAVWIAGIVLSIVFMKKHKRVSMFALAVFILCIVNMFLSLIASTLPYYMNSHGMSIVQIGSYMMGFRIVNTIISIAGWALIITAVFIDRNNPRINTEAVTKKPRRKKE